MLFDSFAKGYAVHRAFLYYFDVLKFSVFSYKVIKFNNKSNFRGSRIIHSINFCKARNWFSVIHTKNIVDFEAIIKANVKEAKVLAEAKKYGFSDDIICRELIQRYVLMKNSTFLKTSLKISVLKTVYALLQSKFTSSYRSLLTFPFNPLYCIYKKKLPSAKRCLNMGN